MQKRLARRGGSGAVLLLGLYYGLYFLLLPDVFAYIAPILGGLIIAVMARMSLGIFARYPRIAASIWVLISALTVIAALIDAPDSIAPLIDFMMTSTAPIVALMSRGEIPVGLIVFLSTSGFGLLFVAYDWYRETNSLRFAWADAKAFFKRNPDATKFSRKDVANARIFQKFSVLLPSWFFPPFSFQRIRMPDGKMGIVRVDREKLGKGASTTYKFCFTAWEDMKGKKVSQIARGVMKCKDESTKVTALQEAVTSERDNYAELGAAGGMSRFSYFYSSERRPNTSKPEKFKIDKFVFSVPGRNLQQIKDDMDAKKIASFTRAQLFSIMVFITQDLQAFHKAKMLHLDIKLANIMVAFRKGKVVGAKLVDVGFSVKADTVDGSLQICLEKLRGTPLFLAPELLTAYYGKNAQYYIYSEATEVFALGVVFGRLLMNQEQFWRRDDELRGMLQELRQQQKRGAVTPARYPHRLFPEAKPGTLKALCNEMTHNLPKSRPPLAQVLERLHALSCPQASPMPAVLSTHC